MKSRDANVSRVCLVTFSEVSKTEGRVGQTTNVVIGGTVADDSTNEWVALDQKVMCLLPCCLPTLLASQCFFELKLVSSQYD